MNMLCWIVLILKRDCNRYGVLHRAIAAGGGSAHLTFEFVKRGLTWADLILAASGYHGDGVEAITNFANALSKTVSNLKGGLAAALLRAGLRNDPGLGQWVGMPGYHSGPLVADILARVLYA